MYKITGIDGRIYGPVTAEQVRSWIAEGRANAQTLVQPEGTSEWHALGVLPEFADAFSGASATTPPPLQAPPPGVQPYVSNVEDVIVEEVLARGPRIEIGACLSRGWDLVMKNFWLTVGASFVVGLIAGAVPLIGAVCWGGFFILLLRLIRGQPTKFEDAFLGFSLAFLQLFLVGLVSGLLVTVGLALLIIPGIYLAVVWLFATPLVVDRQLEFWPAMEVSRRVTNRVWWPLFGLCLVNLLLILAGLLVCCVGVYVAQPIAFAALAYAYDDVFGSPAARA